MFNEFLPNLSLYIINDMKFICTHWLIHYLVQRLQQFSMLLLFVFVLFCFFSLFFFVFVFFVFFLMDKSEDKRMYGNCIHYVDFQHLLASPCKIGVCFSFTFCSIVIELNMTCDIQPKAQCCSVSHAPIRTNYGIWMAQGHYLSRPIEFHRGRTEWWRKTHSLSGRMSV